MEQRSPEWHEARKGKLTASVFGAAAGLGPQSRQQAWRRIVGIEDFEDHAALQWGVDHEQIALAAYQLERAGAAPIVAVGFVPHPVHDWLGCSPDGLVGDDGLVEIKCPFSQQLYEGVPPYYMAQMQGQMEVTGREWCDFVVWTPTQWSEQRVYRSEEYWDWMHLLLADFWMWVVAKCEPPRGRRPQAADIPYARLGPKKIHLS
jgi:putative phage-type endonuclease